jgi:predicted dehydrogenase
MRFALLCDDPLARPMIDALSEQVAGHRLTLAVRATERGDALLHRRLAVTFVEHYEDLAFDKQIDAVLIGGSHPSILDGTKQFAAAGVPVLFLPQVEQGSTFIYELSLVRDDNHVLLFPAFWHRYDTAVIGLKEAIAEGQLGHVQFLQLRRELSRSSAGTPLPQSTVDAELLYDVDLLRWLGGDYDQITALRTGATTEGVLIQSVVLAGKSLPEANWSISPTEGPNQWRLTVRGDAATAELYCDESSRSWTCEINGKRLQGDERATARGLLKTFENAAALQSTVPASTSVPDEGDWGDLVKCFETLDATHRSVRRRRTIELHFEPMSERAIFKTQMTAIGCSVLILTLLLMLCFLGIASVVPLPQPVLKVLRLMVFAPLAFFLIAQVLLPLTRPSSNEQTSVK